MVNYQYKARDKAGKLMQGALAADSESAVAIKLGEMGYFPVVIKEAGGELLQLKKIFKKFRRIKFADLNMFTRQLYTLQKAGLPLLASLRALTVQSQKPIFKSAIEQITHDIEGGSNLSSALARHPLIFNALYVNMIKSGEISGQIVEVLQRLAILGEHEEKIRMRILAAMRYPLMVVASLIIGFLILITLVVPRFADLYSRSTTALPLPTRILIGINFVVTKFWWLMIIAGGIVVWGLRKFINTKKGLLWKDSLILKLPIFGPLMLKLIMSRFCRITSTMMRSGVPILQILELVSQTTDNVVVAKTIDNIKISVNEGKGMLDPMKASGLFPVIVTQMVAVGEETGKIDELLLHVSDYYDEEIDYTIQNLISLIEPMLIFVLGFAVLFMALGIFLPMWNMIYLYKK